MCLKYPSRYLEKTIRTTYCRYVTSYLGKPDVYDARFAESGEKTYGKKHRIAMKRKMWRWMKCMTTMWL